MKDMMGVEIEKGQYVFYFKQGSGGIVHEEAIVIKINPKTVKIGYEGSRSSQGGKKKGQCGNIHNTTGRIFILDKDGEQERRNLERKIKNLTERNKELEEEADKIHNRFNILDL